MLSSASTQTIGYLGLILTAKHTKFVEEVSEGGFQSNAYRKAYDNFTDGTKDCVGGTLLAALKPHPKVNARIV